MFIKKNIILTGSDHKPLLTDIFFKQDGVKKPVIIYLHGFVGFKDWGNFDLVAEQFAEAGFVFIKFNLSHGGTTPEQPEDFADLEAFGNNNNTKEVFDLQYIIDWATGKDNPFANEINAEQVGLLGHSRGGGIVLLKTAEEPKIKAVATWASVAECKTPWGNWPDEKIAAWQKTGVAYYLNGRTKQKLPLYYQLYEDYQDNSKKLDIERSIKEIDNPVLICHGAKDPAVSVDKAYLLHKWQPASELFLVDSDHVFGRSHPWAEIILPQPMQDVLDRTIQFFSSTLVNKY